MDGDIGRVWFGVDELLDGMRGVISLAMEGEVFVVYCVAACVVSHVRCISVELAIIWCEVAKRGAAVAATLVDHFLAEGFEVIGGGMICAANFVTRHSETIVETNIVAWRGSGIDSLDGVF